MPSAAVGAESLSPSEYSRHGASRQNVADSGESFRPGKNTKCLLGLAAGLLLFTGSFDTIIGKYMNKQFMPPGPGKEPRYFEAPWFQTFTMYLGEFLCLFVYYIDRYVQRKRGKANTFDFPTSAKSMNKPSCPKYWWIIPTVLDFIASTLINYAFVFSQASTVQMLRNFNVIVTAFLTFLYLRVALRVHQWLGVCVLTIGLVIIGLYAFLNPDLDNNYSHLQYLGIIMAVGGTLVSAFQFVFEESLFRKYYCSPFEAVGMMGLYGTVLGAVLLIIGEYAGFEHSSVTFYMMGTSDPVSSYLILANCGFVISVATFNGSGLMVTKLGSGLLRTILIAARTFCVWVIELILKWNKFNALNFVGLLVVLIGVGVYNYNYLVEKKGAWFLDEGLRKPLVCMGMKDPDAPEVDERELSRSYMKGSGEKEEENIAKRERLETAPDAEV